MPCGREGISGGARSTGGFRLGGLGPGGLAPGALLPGGLSPQALAAEGWALPLRLDAEGRVATRRPEPVADAATLVLEIVPGERRFLPEFGCRIHLLPGLEGAVERRLAAALVEEALRRWLPALAVEKVDVTAVRGRRVELEIRTGGSSVRLEISHRWPRAPGGPAELHEIDGLHEVDELRGVDEQHGVDELGGAARLEKGAARDESEAPQDGSPGGEAR